jgi:hypothetical protein
MALDSTETEGFIKIMPLHVYFIVDSDQVGFFRQLSRFQKKSKKFLGIWDFFGIWSNFEEL